MPIDAEGIYQYDNTEPAVSPLDDFLNLGMQSVSTTAAAIRAEIAAIDALVDSDWVPIAGSTGGAIGAGWSPLANHTPRVRAVGDRVDIAGALQLTGAGQFTDLLTIPEGFRLAGAYTQYFIGPTLGNNLAATNAIVLELFLSTAHKLLVPVNYRTGSLVANAVVPLTGSWYRN
jgi:hypothetical protein